MVAFEMSLWFIRVPMAACNVRAFCQTFVVWRWYSWRFWPKYVYRVCLLNITRANMHLTESLRQMNHKLLTCVDRCNSRCIKLSTIHVPNWSFLNVIVPYNECLSSGCVSLCVYVCFKNWNKWLATTEEVWSWSCKYS